jgi:hypothetical protein
MYGVAACSVGLRTEEIDRSGMAPRQTGRPMIALRAE